MNKRELIEAVGGRIGDKVAAAAAVDAFVETIGDTVAKDEKVVIPGFGTFERVTRPARDARNPATGATIHVPATAVPKFKAGTTFKGKVAGTAS